MRYAPDYRPPWNLKRRRPWAPGEGPDRVALRARETNDETSLFPGSQVREMWKLPQVPEEHAGPVIPIHQPGNRQTEQTEENAAPTPDQVTASQVEAKTEVPADPRPNVALRARGEKVMPENSSPLPIQKEEEEFTTYEAEIEAAAAAYEAAERKRRADRQRELVAGRPSRKERERSSKLARFPLDEAKAVFAAFVQSTLQAPASAPPPDLERHSRRCMVCAHPDRDAIEGEFIRWHNPVRIAQDYGIADRNSVYRHAHATGLMDRRRREAARILEKVLERAESTPTDEFDVITRALRLYAHLDDDARYREPIRTHHVLHGKLDSGSGLVDTKSVDTNPELRDQTAPPTAAAIDVTPGAPEGPASE